MCGLTLCENCGFSAQLKSSELYHFHKVFRSAPGRASKQPTRASPISSQNKCYFEHAHWWLMKSLCPSSDLICNTCSYSPRAHGSALCLHALLCHLQDWHYRLPSAAWEVRREETAGLSSGSILQTMGPPQACPLSTPWQCLLDIARCLQINSGAIFWQKQFSLPKVTPVEQLHRRSPKGHPSELQSMLDFDIIKQVITYP